MAWHVVVTVAAGCRASCQDMQRQPQFCRLQVLPARISIVSLMQLLLMPCFLLRQPCLPLLLLWLSGYDTLPEIMLKGVYLKPSKRIHPEIYHLKEAMKQAPDGVEIFIDPRLQPALQTLCGEMRSDLELLQRTSTDIRRKRGFFSTAANLTLKTARRMPAYSCCQGGANSNL